MPIPRIFQPVSLEIGSTIQLDPYATHHVSRVLRAGVDDTVIIFNGEGGEYQGTIEEISKKTVTVTLHHFHSQDNESSLQLYLAQGISRGEKMDFTIQKAVELGVKKIFPLITERCNVKLDEERAAKRLQHWSSVIISACEQSGRNLVPEIAVPQTLQHFLSNTRADHRFVLAPGSQGKLSELSIKKTSSVILLIGPEGGLTEAEIALAEQNNYSLLTLGPRILRTETAGITALSVLQFYAGDLC